MIENLQAPSPVSSSAHPQGRTLREVSVELEASFLAEMLKHAQPDQSGSTFGGGIGEAQFSSFMREAQAAEMARAGGIGLADTIFAALVATQERTAS